jgi:hypothetical protein
LDGAKLYFNRAHQRLIDSVTGTNLFIGQYEYFVQHRAVFVSSKARMDLIVQYLNIVYKKQYSMICTKEFPSALFPEQSLGLFMISEQSNRADTSDSAKAIKY